MAYKDYFELHLPLPKDLKDLGWRAHVNENPSIDWTFQIYLTRWVDGHLYHIGSIYSPVECDGKKLNALKTIRHWILVNGEDRTKLSVDCKELVED